MKKIMFVLALLVLAVPVWAATNVEITCQTTPGDPEAEIGYIKTGDGHVRAFALNIVVTSQTGAPVILDVNCVNADYYIYPGSIGINEQGEVTDDGSCVCDDGQYPVDTLAGPPDSNGVTIEMGSLYDDVPPLDDPEHQTPPSDSGTLLILTVDLDSCITVTENILRGGIVLEDPQASATLDLPDGNDCCVTGLDPYANTCWSAIQCPGQALGDATCDGTVNAVDLFKLKQSWLKKFGDVGYNCCANFNHDTFGVNAVDLFILKQNWLSTALGGDLTQGCPATEP